VKFNPGDYEVKQVFYPSKDGTKVPMFIVAKKGLKLDGNNPVCLTGYGGFNISMTPSFRATCASWIDKGGVFALPNLRLHQLQAVILVFNSPLQFCRNRLPVPATAI